MFQAGSKYLGLVFAPVDRFFDWFYGSKLNPLYRSGTLAVCLLTIALCTGFYLLIFYRLSAPYESMVEINNQLLFGRWIRALHRYSSDLAAAVVVYHSMRMFSDGKTWGPRLLAWMSGIIIFFVMLVIGWTGFVLVWDRHAQALAVAGSKIFSTIPLFSEIMSRSLSGATPIGSSFFFLNLFIHMSLPLAIIFGLWLHTSNLRKPAWFPRRNAFLGITACLTLFAMIWPAPLAEKADLLQIGGTYPLNWFYSFAIPTLHILKSEFALYFFAILFLALFFIPLYWRPKPENSPLKSKHDPRSCTGCSQCSNDCPFTAIEMVARTEGTGSEKVAEVDPAACVGCGICSASCSQLAIGPEDKSSRAQLQQVLNYKKLAGADSILFIHCDQGSLAKELVRYHSAIKLVEYKIPCAGMLHPATVATALSSFKGVYILGCPIHACTNRLGQELAAERFLNDRDPFVKMDKKRLQIFSGALSELDLAKESLASFANQIGLAVPEFKADSKPLVGWVKQAAITFGLLALLAWLSAFQFDDRIEGSVLRVSIRLPGQAVESCRERTDEELAKMPMHMRNRQDCTRKSVDYKLTVFIDDKLAVEEIVRARGARGDKPLLANHDFSVTAEKHKIKVSFMPLGEDLLPALALNEEFEEVFEDQKAILVGFNANIKQLYHSKTAAKQ